MFGGGKIAFTWLQAIVTLHECSYILFNSEGKVQFLVLLRCPTFTGLVSCAVVSAIAANSFFFSIWPGMQARIAWIWCRDKWKQATIKDPTIKWTYKIDTIFGRRNACREMKSFPTPYVVKCPPRQEAMNCRLLSSEMDLKHTMGEDWIQWCMFSVIKILFIRHFSASSTSAFHNRRRTAIKILFIKHLPSSLQVRHTKEEEGEFILRPSCSKMLQKTLHSSGSNSSPTDECWRGWRTMAARKVTAGRSFWTKPGRDDPSPRRRIGHGCCSMWSSAGNQTPRSISHLHSTQLWAP